MNMLFVCTMNRWRSLTAEHIFRNLPGTVIRSAGTATNARRKVNSTDIDWANVIFVMEKKHQEILEQKFPSQINNKQVICLEIPDEYQYMDDDLVTLLKESVSSFLDKAN